MCRTESAHSRWRALRSSPPTARRSWAYSRTDWPFPLRRRPRHSGKCRNPEPGRTCRTQVRSSLPATRMYLASRKPCRTCSALHRRNSALPDTPRNPSCLRTHRVLSRIARPIAHRSWERSRIDAPRPPRRIAEAPGSSRIRASMHTRPTRHRTMPQAFGRTWVRTCPCRTGSAPPLRTSCPQHTLRT